MLAWEDKFYRPDKPFRHCSRLRRIMDSLLEYSVIAAATGGAMWLLIELGTRNWSR